MSLGVKSGWLLKKPAVFKGFSFLLNLKNVRSKFTALAVNGVGRAEPMRKTGDVVIIGGRAFPKAMASQLVPPNLMATNEGCPLTAGRVLR